MKIFMGFDVPPELSEQLDIFRQQNIQPGLSFVKKENRHITAFYLGSIKLSNIEQIKSKINSVCKQTKPFSLNANKITFSLGKKPNMVWQYFEDQPDFSVFNLNLIKVLKKQSIGIQKFNPHITIARFSKDKKFYKLKSNDIKQYKFEVNKLVLWQSAKNEKSNKYTMIHKFDLKNE